MREGAHDPVADGAAARTAARPLDAHALARHAQRLMRAPAPWLHEEVARRMAERLALLKTPPRRIVDWGASLGASAVPLQRAAPAARRVPADALPGVGGPARAAPSPAPALRWWSARRWWPRGAPVAPTIAEADLPQGEADLLWSNMTLHHLADPQRAMQRWLQLLAVQGLLMFSTLGPGTLASLRRLYAGRQWPSPHAAFVDMHDLGDMLVQAGFADPVMDQELLTLSWDTPGAALRELRQLGGNADPARHAGLRTPRWRATLEQALAAARPGERVTLEFEIVYGHAVRPPPRARMAAQTTVPLADLRQALRSRAGSAAEGAVPHAGAGSGTR
ncbi:MAG: methyltransferase domain-containing protein [Rubrivivax sp.]|nr:methyltransferase domain-containing protein [Rubrivivax sp.]